MKKRVILILFSFLFLIIFFQPLITDKVLAWEERKLEVTYPKIGTEAPPTTIKAGLPNYIKYIFTLAVGIIGFIIFGVLIYSGILYLTSAGNTNQMTDARDRIQKAFLGGILLLASVLIFNTINPQLTILELEPIKIIPPFLTPGVYICSTKIDNIGGLLDKYLGDNPDERKKAVEEITEILKDKNKKCNKFENSDKLRPPLKTESSFTVFIIPPWRQSGWDYEYGIILHQEENYTGQCKIITSTGYSAEDQGRGDIYQQINPYHPNLEFDAKSITIFQKLTEKFDYLAYLGITLYQKTGFEERGGSFSLEHEEHTIGFASSTQLDAVGVYQNAWSIKIEPRGGYFVLLKGDKGKRCQIEEGSDSSFVNEPMGSCGFGCKVIGGFIEFLPGKQCKSCLEKLWMIKGKVLR